MLLSKLLFPASIVGCALLLMTLLHLFKPHRIFGENAFVVQTPTTQLAGVCALGAALLNTVIRFIVAVKTTRIGAELSPQEVWQYGTLGNIIGLVYLLSFIFMVWNTIKRYKKEIHFDDYEKNLLIKNFQQIGVAYVIMLVGLIVIYFLLLSIFTSL